MYWKKVEIAEELLLKAIEADVRHAAAWAVLLQFLYLNGREGEYDEYLHLLKQSLQENVLRRILEGLKK